MTLLPQLTGYADFVTAPAQEAVQFQKQRFDAELVIESDFIGPPTPASDLAWHTLLQSKLTLPETRTGMSTLRFVLIHELLDWL